jgi:hypothetical protein
MRTNSTMCTSERIKVGAKFNKAGGACFLGRAAKTETRALEKEQKKVSVCVAVHSSHSIRLAWTKIKPALAEMLALMMWKNWGAGDDWFDSDSVSLGGMPITVGRLHPLGRPTFSVLTTCFVPRELSHQHFSQCRWDENDIEGSVRFDCRQVNLSLR